MDAGEWEGNGTGVEENRVRAAIMLNFCVSGCCAESATVCECGREYVCVEVSLHTYVCVSMCILSVNLANAGTAKVS